VHGTIINLITDSNSGRNDGSALAAVARRRQHFKDHGDWTRFDELLLINSR